MTSLTEFLFPAPAPRRPGAILAWWERRRLPYNLMVGSAGLVTLAVAQGYMWIFPGPGQGVPWQPVVAYGVLANLCYFFGPAIELLIEKAFGGRVLPTGPGLYRMGLTFAVGLTLFPILFLTVSAVVRVVLALF
jgi:hypothetical protein